MPEAIDLSASKLPAGELAQRAQVDPALLAELLDGVSPAAQKGARRENCSQGLMRLAELDPRTLLPHWDYLVGLLSSDNGFSQYVAAYTLASLAGAAGQERFAAIFQFYMGLLEGESVMVAGHVALNAARVAQALPGLRSRIARRLIQEGGPTKLEVGRQDLVRAYIIEALASMMPDLEHRGDITAYVRRAEASTSPKTRKLAKAFLKQWPAT